LVPMSRRLLLFFFDPRDRFNASTLQHSSTFFFMNL